MPMKYIVICEADNADRDDRASFRRGFLLEDPDAKDVQDSTWLVQSSASNAGELIDNIVRHIREERIKKGPHDNLRADFYAAQIDEVNRDGRLVTFY